MYAAMQVYIQYDGVQRFSSICSVLESTFRSFPHRPQLLSSIYGFGFMGLAASRDEVGPTFRWTLQSPSSELMRRRRDSARKSHIGS